MKNILVVDRSIPNIQNIGSWDILLSNLILEKSLVFDKIICSGVPNIITEQHSFANKSFKRYVNKFIFKDNKRDFFLLMKNYIASLKSNEKIRIHIFDDINLLLSINKNSIKFKLREKVEIVYNLRGFNFDVSTEKRQEILNSIDILVLLSYSSLNHLILNNHSLPCEVRVKSNGIDSKKFFPADNTEKLNLRMKFGIDTDKKVYLWLSQDRKKKGLHLVLKAWDKFHEANPNTVLVILGTQNEILSNGVFWLERRANDKLPEIYQLSDFFIFSTLCHEGHPLALTEALKCGSYPLASNIDPISEILQQGKFGCLVKNPNMVESWLDALNRTTLKSFSNSELKEIKNLYNIEDWVLGYNNILMQP